MACTVGKIYLSIFLKKIPEEVVCIIPISNLGQSLMKDTKITLSMVKMDFKIALALEKLTRKKSRSCVNFTEKSNFVKTTIIFECSELELTVLNQ